MSQPLDSAQLLSALDKVMVTSTTDLQETFYPGKHGILPTAGYNNSGAVYQYRYRTADRIAARNGSEQRPVRNGDDLWRQAL